MSSKNQLITLLFLSLVWFLIGWFAQVLLTRSNLRLVNAADQHLSNQLWVDSIDQRQVEEAAVRGMIEAYADAQAALIGPEVSDRFMSDFDGKAGVTGLFAEERNGEIVVTYVIPGDPAEQSGIRAGDVFVSIDGIPVEELTELELAFLVRGKAHESAEIVMRRENDLLTFRPVRKPMPLVSLETFDDGVVYLAQETFRTDAFSEMERVAQEASDARVVIWDLRQNNGGGMLTAQQVISLFVEDGVLFYAETKNGEREAFSAMGEAMLAETPFIILIDDTTKSAAETAAVAMRHYGRATLIGETSFGKGTIQTTIALPYDYLLQFTVAKWLGPDGNWYDKLGIQPDIVVVDKPETVEDEVLEAALRHAATLR